jgi:CDP-glucose 4,6-dehydratase
VGGRKGAVEGMVNFECYQGKRVLVTGHTGFKGSWLCEWLLALGAEVYGFSNGIPTRPSLFSQLRLSKRIRMDLRGDIRDRVAVKAAMTAIKPDFVFHLAAQPLVRESYEQPVETFDTNVMGTVHVLDALRFLENKCNVVLVTTDKCYENKERMRPYKEDDPMGGYDPYSCSKGCDELVISSYRRSFFNDPSADVWIASARAGNVIGGGDWAKDRIIPDCFRALQRGESISVRNKCSTRPWQHVLEPLSGYLALGAALDARTDFESVASGFNFGPNPNANRTVKDVVEELLLHAKGKWVDQSDPCAVHEAGLLNLDIRKAARVLRWKPTWNFAETIEKVADWYVGVQKGEKPLELTQKQIAEFVGKR